MRSKLCILKAKMEISIGQIILIVWIGINLIAGAYLHGKNKTELVYSFWSSLIGTILQIGIILPIVYWW